jgi:hypothetical protein
VVAFSYFLYEYCPGYVAIWTIHFIYRDRKLGSLDFILLTCEFVRTFSYVNMELAKMLAHTKICWME